MLKPADEDKLTPVDDPHGELEGQVKEKELIPCSGKLSGMRVGFQATGSESSISR